MKVWIKRALRTFLQAAVGFASANVVIYFADVGPSEISSAICGITTAAVAAGLAAVMNMKEGDGLDR